MNQKELSEFYQLVFISKCQWIRAQYLEKNFFNVENAISHVLKYNEKKISQALTHTKFLCEEEKIKKNNFASYCMNKGSEPEGLNPEEYNALSSLTKFLHEQHFELNEGKMIMTFFDENRRFHEPTLTSHLTLKLLKFFYKKYYDPNASIEKEYSGEKIIYKPIDLKIQNKEELREFFYRVTSKWFPNYCFLLNLDIIFDIVMDDFYDIYLLLLANDLRTFELEIYKFYKNRPFKWKKTADLIYYLLPTAHKTVHTSATVFADPFREEFAKKPQNESFEYLYEIKASTTFDDDY
jgi:hypothetical protein